MFERYAIFYTPTNGLADWGAAWLGWDSAAGRVVAHPKVESVDVADVTGTPRKYGLHGTLKAPFRLAAHARVDDLHAAVADFARHHRAVDLGALALRYDHGFVALRPGGDMAKLRALAGEIVKAFDMFRAPLSDADIARRRRAGLSDRQDRQMLDWGYPFIFDDFNFHLTLSGRLSDKDAARVIAALTPMVDPVLPSPFVIDAIAVMGQDRAGMFHQIHRYDLTG